MAKAKMRDLVVLLPGITGSVLQKNGKDLWDVSGNALWSALTSLSNNLQALKLPDHDPGVEPPDDGVRATALIQKFHGVFGLGRIDGYTALAHLIANNFEVIAGSVAQPTPANFIEFPYDWRQSNRTSARRLKRVIDERLALWREWSHWHDARTILIAHSMGGLVARYYLEVLDGWRDCKALVTFGTPYRGSVDAVNYLANGYKNVLLDLTEVMRSFPSVYELLPIYPMVKTGASKYARVAEIDGIPNVSQVRAADALKFHREIESKVEAHLNDAEYMSSRYIMLPVSGIAQPTLQSAELSGVKLVVSAARPGWIEEELEGGDGTVLRVSATPIELSSALSGTFLAERHSSLQNNDYALDNLGTQMKQMQATGLGNVRGTWAAGVSPAPIGLNLEDLYSPEETVRIQATLAGAFGVPKAELCEVSGENRKWQADFRSSGGDFELVLPGLAPGQYRIKVHSAKGGPGAPRPVTDVFEVIG